MLITKSWKQRYVKPLTNGLRLWLDAKDLIGTADSTPISTWSDKSDAADDATAAGGARPTWMVDYAGLGRDALVFNGSSNLMNITGSADITQTWLVLLRRAGDSGVLGVGTTSNRGMDVSAIEGKIRNRSWNGDGDTDEVSIISSILGDYYVLTTRFDSGSIEAFVDNNGDGATSHATPAAITIDEIGATGTGLGRNYFNGGMLEVLNYNRVLTDAEMIYMQRYFDLKWSL